MIIIFGSSGSTPPPTPFAGSIITGGLGTPRLITQGFFGGVGPVLPTSLIAAIIAAAQADSTLAGITGGFHSDEVPPPTPTIYCVVSQAGSNTDSNFGDYVWTSDRIKFRVYGTAKDATNLLFEQLMVSVPRWGALEWTRGYSIPFVEASRATGKTMNRTSGKVAAWWFDGVFKVRCNKLTS